MLRFTARVLFLIFLTSACASQSSRVTPPEQAHAPEALDPRLAWSSDVREKLDDFLLRPDHFFAVAQTPKPWVAVFDWDNTIIKNDISDAITYYFLQHDRVRRPRRWSDLSPYLTQKALDALQ